MGKMTVVFLSLFVMTFLIQAQEQTVPDPATQSIVVGLGQVNAWREKAADIHPAFARTYPIAVVKDLKWQVFETASGTSSWKLAAAGSLKNAVPAGVRAAMPLPFWGNRMACVVSPEVFDAPEGYAFILHEFVHCYQWETVEGKLKEGLDVCRQAMARQDYMWELQHPFPYADAEVSRVYASWLAALRKGDMKEANRWRSQLKKGLNRHDWEYMTWQEWKEGLARYLENKVRERFALKANLPAVDAAFDRVTFYYGGELFISRLAEMEPGLDKDTEGLYHRIFASGG